MKIIELMEPNNIRMLYIDMDGVIADFAKAVRTHLIPEWTEDQAMADKKLNGRLWKGVTQYQRAGGDFWFDMDPMPDAHQLMEYVKKYPHQILTAAGNPEYNAGEQKLRWMAKHFGTNIKVNVVRKAAEKAQFASPSSVLIDDKLKALNPWTQAGGIGVLHISASDSISQLNELGL